MNVLKFVEELKKIAPSKASLEELGFDTEFIEEYHNSYFINHNKTDDDVLNPILNLIDECDLKNVEIGFIRFYSKDEVLENHRYIVFGQYDADVLAIDKLIDEIVLIESIDPDNIMMNVSRSSETFLEALLRIARFNKKILLDEIEDDNINKEILKEAYKICEIVGGENYLDFYLMVLGYDG